MGACYRSIVRYDSTTCSNDHVCVRNEGLSSLVAEVLQKGMTAGIGKALACKCAEQGLNVVLVARPDDLMDAIDKELPARYPEVEFRMVPVDLSTKGYVRQVSDAVKDILVQVCFLNAGYIQTGFFVKTTLEKNYANLECNVGHVVGLSHMLINQLQDAGRPGCLVFTSSAAAVMPAPFASLYNSTKAFLSAFGSSIAAEVRQYDSRLFQFVETSILGVLKACIWADDLFAF